MFVKVIKKIFFVLESAAAVAVGTRAILLLCSSAWMFHTWPKLNMDELMYQLNAPIEEKMNLSMVMEYINYCIPASILG